MDIDAEKRRLADQMGISLGILNKQIRETIEELSGLIDEEGAIVIIKKNFEAKNEKKKIEIMKSSKSTNFFDMLEKGSYGKLKSEDLPPLFILKIEDLLKWKGLNPITNKEQTTPYIRGIIYYQVNGKNIEQSITWFPPQAVLTHFTRLEVKINSIVKINNMGKQKVKGTDKEYWNMFVELLEP